MSQTQLSRKEKLGSLASAAGRLGGSAILAAKIKLILGSGYIRAIAYHAVPSASLDSFRRQLDWLAARYRCLDEEGLAAFCAGNPEKAEEKPGLIISFDDGQINNYRYAVPALEERGLRGWFFIPSMAPGLSGAEEARFCRDGTYELPADAEADGRLVMNWDEVRDLSVRGHSIGCHTASHRRLRDSLTPTELETEILQAKAKMEQELGHHCLSFAFVGGEQDTYSPGAYSMIRSAGFRFGFTTLSAPFCAHDNPFLIHRTMLDPDMDFDLFKFKISGLSDLVHKKAREKIENRLENL